MRNTIGKEYINFLNEIKSRILTARIQAIRSVNKELIRLYWDIGKTIVTRQKKYKWGDAVVEKLAKDLKEAFPQVHGFSERNVWSMRRFMRNIKISHFCNSLLQKYRGGIIF